MTWPDIFDAIDRGGKYLFYDAPWWYAVAGFVAILIALWLIPSRPRMGITMPVPQYLVGRNNPEANGMEGL